MRNSPLQYKNFNSNSYIHLKIKEQTIDKRTNYAKQTFSDKVINSRMMEQLKILNLIIPSKQKTKKYL
jgi:hypothetical protein